MNVTVPSFAPGDTSLPADVRAGRAGLIADGRTRLLLGQRHTGMRVEPRGYYAAGEGMGDILAGNFVVPQNPMRVRVSTGTSGVGRLRRMAQLQGLGQDPCDPTDPAYDPTVCEESMGTTPAELPPVTETPFPIVENVNPVVQYQIPSSVVQAPAGYSGPTQVAGNAATPPAPSGYQWATVANQAGNTLAKVLTIAQGGAALQLPGGNQLLYGSPQSALTAGTLGVGANAFGTALGQVSPVLLIGGLALVLLVMGGNRGR